MSETSFAGRTALVTGGAVRLGRAIALRLAAEGANVGIHYGRSAAEACEVVGELAALGVRGCAVQGDFSDDCAPVAEQVLLEVEQQLGPVDLLINSAAIFEPGSLQSTDSDAWDRHLEINLKAPVWLARVFAARLPAGTPGAIVNMIDWRGVWPRPGHLAYTVAKAGLVAATKILAQELGPAIRVNAVAPGAILPAPGSDASAFEALGARNPLQRTGSPDDVAEAVLYLLTSRFVTGEVLCVTGGEQL